MHLAMSGFFRYQAVTRLYPALFRSYPALDKIHPALTGNHHALFRFYPALAMEPRSAKKVCTEEP